MASKKGPDAKPHTKTIRKPGVKSRSRSGCVTCRAKHAKCDETKPQCLVCTSKGLACGGYRRQLKWSTKHQRTSNSVTSEQSQTITTASQASRSQPDAWVTPSGEASNVLDQDDATWALMLDPLVGWPSDAGSPLKLGNMSSRSEVIGPEMPRWETWSPTSNSNMQVSPLQLASLPGPLDTETTEDIILDSGARITTVSQQRQPSTPIFASITDTSSLLISHWFRDVCTVWSAYDSHMNINRTLAMSLWSDSEVVSTCLQSMSAAFLATKIPSMKKTSLTMMKDAAAAIRTELAATQHPGGFKSVPTGILFALFCLGTTICWIDASQLGIPFLKEAKSLLDRLKQQSRGFSARDHNLLAFFDKSWIYCDMLLTVVSNNEWRLQMQDKSPDVYGVSLDSPSDVEIYDMPHPWTGISTLPSRLFTQAIKLCREFRQTLRRQGRTAGELRAALQLTEEAPKIEEQLLQLEYDSIPLLNETGDQRTPCSHLVKVAEAYRLAALLQLYQTFPDLVALRLPRGRSSLSEEQVPWKNWIIPLSLRLIGILEQIPPGSGSRMVQPLLCITASTGLRFENALPAGGSQPIDEFGPSKTAKAPPISQECDILDYVNQMLGAEPMERAPSSPTQLTLEVGNARHFILKRLNILENSLPPKPIIMARTLIQAIWTAYDAEAPGQTAVHWVDVMESKGLKSFFG